VTRSFLFFSNNLERFTSSTDHNLTIISPLLEPISAKKALKIMPAVRTLKEIANLVIRGRKPESVTKEGEVTDMLVIGAGFPRTGTSSLKTALERLGLKSYHMTNAMMMDPELWYEHVLERKKGNPGIYPKIMDSMAEQGYTATVDNPNILHYKELMERYPKAKIIMGVRVEGGGESYAVSVLNTIARFGPLFKRVPYKWFPLVQKIDALHEWHLAEHGSPLHRSTHYPKYQDLVDSYDSWVQRVPETVPAEKLLVFKPTDGWEPLCNFVSPLDPTIEMNCRQVLENNEPYPYINDRAALQGVQNGLHWIAVIVENVPTFIVFGLVVWWTVKRAQQNAPPKRRIKRKTH
jgi:hypothetical protein